MPEKVHDAIFEGDGPFATPLLAKFVSVDLRGRLDVAVARFEFEDGPIIDVPISSQAAYELEKALGVWRVKVAEKTRH